LRNRALHRCVTHLSRPALSVLRKDVFLLVSAPQGTESAWKKDTLSPVLRLPHAREFAPLLRHPRQNLPDEQQPAMLNFNLTSPEPLDSPEAAGSRCRLQTPASHRPPLTPSEVLTWGSVTDQLHCGGAWAHRVDDGTACPKAATPAFAPLRCAHRGLRRRRGGRRHGPRRACRRTLRLGTRQWGVGRSI
jgi:hypothetical protein